MGIGGQPDASEKTMFHTEKDPKGRLEKPHCSRRSEVSSVARCAPEAQARSVTMTVTRMSYRRRRPEPIPAHVYTMPVVRELPPPVVDAFGAGTW
jgi:hypothetical protein